MAELLQRGRSQYRGSGIMIPSLSHIGLNTRNDRETGHSAALDLGSNSFHLQIGRVVDDQVYLLEQT